jgi:prepilin-type N-terminal cleavage/methylation domain-containing protein
MKKRDGFTLIEVLVALVVIGLAATATATGMRATTNLLGMNEQHARAITLTQAAVEDLRTVDYENMLPGSSSTDDGFTTVWTIQGNTPGPGMKLITATTSWNWRGKEQSYTLHTVYSRISPN